MRNPEIAMLFNDMERLSNIILIKNMEIMMNARVADGENPDNAR